MTLNHFAPASLQLLSTPLRILLLNNFAQSESESETVFDSVASFPFAFECLCLLSKIPTKLAGY